MDPTMSMRCVRFICGCVWAGLKFHFTMFLDRSHLDAHLFSLDNGPLRAVHRVCVYIVTSNTKRTFWILVICLHLLFGWAFHFFWYSSYFNSFWLLKMPSFVKTTAICNRSSSEGGKLFISLMCPQKVHTSIWNYQNADQNENVLRKWNAMHQSPWGKMLPPIFFSSFMHVSVLLQIVYSFRREFFSCWS